MNNNIYTLFYRIFRLPWSIYRYMRCRVVFGKIGKHTYVLPPFTVEGGGIFIGDQTVINKYAWLMTLPLTEEADARIIIGSRCRIAFYAHIVATHRVIIGNNVNIANSVYLSDNIHGYEDIDIPPRDQPIVQKSDVIIGDDTWLGERVAVIGARIGKHCVIGAHSVVTRDIPDYCVAVGAPARIIKRYDLSRQEWRKTDSCGNFTID